MYQDNENKCLKCNRNTIGDVFHYLFVCSLFRQPRLERMSPTLYINPSMVKLDALMISQDAQVLRNVCKFKKVIFNEFRQ